MADDPFRQGIECFPRHSDEYIDFSTSIASWRPGSTPTPYRERDYRVNELIDDATHASKKFDDELSTRKCSGQIYYLHLSVAITLFRVAR